MRSVEKWNMSASVRRYMAEGVATHTCASLLITTARSLKRSHDLPTWDADARQMMLLRSTQYLKLYISLNVLLFYFSMPNCRLALKILENLTKEFEKNNGGA